MIAATALVPRLRREGRTETAAVRRFRRWPVENTFLFLITFVAYMALADYLVIHLHYMNADAYSRVANATYVLYSRDPHLGAIGFVWPPLPSLLDMPILLLHNWFPFLITQAFAGSVEAALFGAGTVVLLNLAMRRAGVIMPIRWIVLAVWLVNPMTAIYSTQGMSEAPFVFFVIATFLQFMRWADSRRPQDLALLGVLAGLGTLCRVEMIPVALVLAGGVLFCTLGRRISWKEVETRVLLYGLPMLFTLGLWLGSSWVIEHDPLFFVHSAYGTVSQSVATNGYGVSASAYSQWPSAFAFTGKASFLLYPAVTVLMGLVLLRAIVGRHRRPAVVLLMLGLPVPLLDVYLLHAHELPTILRYDIFVIPYAVVLGVFLLNELKKVSPRVVSVAALLLVALMALSNISSFDIMSDSTAAPEEAAAIQAAENDVTAAHVNTLLDPYDSGAAVAAAVQRADTDHGLIAMDTFEGGNVYMTAPDRSIYVVTSDTDFEAVVHQPYVYHVEYFLVPDPSGEGSLDRINTLYPGMWASGGGGDHPATEVAYIGGLDHWKLYRVNAGTGSS